jgi:hypothetical protein
VPVPETLKPGDRVKSKTGIGGVIVEDDGNDKFKVHWDSNAIMWVEGAYLRSHRGASHASA